MLYNIWQIKSTLNWKHCEGTKKMKMHVSLSSATNLYSQMVEVPAKERKQALKRLPSYARPVVKKMDEVQNTYLGKYARRIQGHMRGEFGRNLYEIQKRRILKERERAKMVRASLMISKRTKEY